jgi:carbonic anhydrase
VLLGLVLALARVLYRLARATVTATEADGVWTVRIRGSLVFLGVASLVRTLRSIPQGATVRIDLTVNHLDHAASEAIEDWRRGHIARGGSVEVYRDGSERVGDQLDDVPIRALLAKLAAEGQQPAHLFITCADSRIVPTMITTSGPGDQFCVRNIGNLVPPKGSNSNSVDAAIEYAVDVLGVKSIVVCGHSSCGAAAAALAADVPEGSGLENWLRHLEPSVRRAVALPDIVDPATGLQLSPADKLSVANVAVQLENLRSFPCVRAAEDQGRLELIGLWFDIGAATARSVVDRAPFLVRGDEELLKIRSSGTASAIATNPSSQ